MEDEVDKSHLPTAREAADSLPEELIEVATEPRSVAVGTDVETTHEPVSRQVPPEVPLAALPDPALAAAIERIEVAVRERLAASDKSALVIERLYEEVRGFRQRQEARRFEPLLRSLVHLRDDLGVIAEGARHPESPTNRDDLVRYLENFRDQVEEILAREGAQSFRPEAGTPFDPKRHQVINTVPTDEPQQHGTVIVVRQPGFCYDERVLRPALVNAAKWTAPTTVLDQPATKPTSRPNQEG